MPHQTFQDEYTFARDHLRGLIAAKAFETSSVWRGCAISSDEISMGPLIRAIMNLPLVLGPDGFIGAHHPILATYQYALTQAAQGRSEADVLLDVVGFSRAQTAADRELAVQRVAALKLFRHCYRVSSVGAQTIWVVSQPTAYSEFTTDMIWAQRAGGFMLRHLLNQTIEIYTPAERDLLAVATQDAGDWCSRATIDAMSQSAESQARIERWFGPQADDAASDRLRQKLTLNFARMRGRVEENRIIYVDRPYARRDTDRVLAAVYKTEALRSIYIKRAFFDMNGGPMNLPGPVASTLTIVHELSHRVADTHDHKYDHQNLHMRASFRGDAAACNADSWAYYAADVMGLIPHGRLPAVMVA